MKIRASLVGPCAAALLLFSNFSVAEQWRQYYADDETIRTVDVDSVRVGPSLVAFDVRATFTHPRPGTIHGETYSYQSSVSKTVVDCSQKTYGFVRVVMYAGQGFAGSVVREVEPFEDAKRDSNVHPEKVRMVAFVCDTLMATARGQQEPESEKPRRQAPMEVSPCEARVVSKSLKRSAPDTSNAKAQFVVEVSKCGNSLCFGWIKFNAIWDQLGMEISEEQNRDWENKAIGDAARVTTESEEVSLPSQCSNAELSDVDIQSRADSVLRDQRSSARTRQFATGAKALSKVGVCRPKRIEILRVECERKN